MTLADVLAGLTLAGLTAGMGVPIAGSIIEDLKLDAAVQTLAGEIHTARMTAISSGRHSGIVFDSKGGDGAWRHYRDGGGSGIRSSEIAAGVNLPTGSSRFLSSEHPGIRFGFPVSPIPAIPPSTAILDSSIDPIALGTTDIFSASPHGGTTGGSIYLTDGSNMRVLVIYGPTGRLSVWRYSRRDSTWRRPL